MAKLVRTFDEIVENVRQFNADLDSRSDLVTQLSLFRHWYYIQELDAFGPSKFIGYSGMNVDRYNRGDDKDGKETEPHLLKWFVQLEKSTDLWRALYNGLESRLDEFGKSPNRLTQVHLPRLA